MRPSGSKPSSSLRSARRAMAPPQQPHTEPSGAWHCQGRGWAASSDSVSPSFLTYPLGDGFSSRPLLHRISEQHFPGKREIAASHITHELWCELLHNRTTEELLGPSLQSLKPETLSGSGCPRIPPFSQGWRITEPESPGALPSPVVYARPRSAKRGGQSQDL